MSACLTPEAVNQAFLAAPPFIAQQILDLTIQHPSFLKDVPSMKDWPTGVGNSMQQLVIRGEMPQIERGFAEWNKKADLSGCDPCAAPNCSYNWTQFPGHGIDRKTTNLMDRDFRTPAYCVKEIQSTAHFKEVFAKIVENMYVQIDFFKSQNIVLNTFALLSKKFVVDSDGPKCNRTMPYSYPNVGTAKLSNLNIELLELFYEQMRRIPSCVPYDVVDGNPLFAIIGSQRVFSRMYRDDASLRQDVRFSGLANANLLKYNFMSTFRGMFLPASILYPRRFIIVGGEPVEVLPFVNGVPAEVGSYTNLNPAYLNDATHEEIIMHGKYPFEIFTQTTESALPGNASFGPEVTFMSNWIWNNPMTTQDPGRREGFFWTSASIGISQQFSDGMFAVLVELPSNRLASQFNPSPICPPTIPTCTNSIPDTDCPCPMVMDLSADPFAVNTYDVSVSVPVLAGNGDAINFALANGTEVFGEVVQITSDLKTIKVLFGNGLPTCPDVVSIFCNSTAGCSASVQSVEQCGSSTKLVLSNPILAIVGDHINVYYGDCTSASVAISAVDVGGYVYTIPNDATVICAKGGISKVCVPTATNGACPDCDTTITACVEPIG